MLANYIINPNHYKEEKTIGEGKFGSVLLAYLESNHEQKVALKKIPVDYDDNDSQKFFIREVSIMSDLEHPSIIKLIGFSLPSKNDMHFKIYSEYIPNGTLLEALSEDELNDECSKILTPTIRSKIVYGIASAIKCLHKMKIIHRDLKPENIFLDEDYQPVISDFGLSRYCNNDLAMTKKLGTPYYMAPELFSEDDDDSEPITNKIDVYAFSLTLLSMFSTKFVFTGRKPRSISQLVNHIMNGKRYAIPDSVPEFYKNLIQKCWSSNPLERPSFEQIVEIFDKNDDFIFDGSDIDDVHKYMKYLENHDIDSKLNGSYITSSSTSENESDQYEEEETQEFDFNI